MRERRAHLVVPGSVTNCYQDTSNTCYVPNPSIRKLFVLHASHLNFDFPSVQPVFSLKKPVAGAEVQPNPKISYKSSVPITFAWEESLSSSALAAFPRLRRGVPNEGS